MKALILFILLFMTCLSGFSQNSIKTTGDCTDVIAQEAGGKWIKTTDVGSINSKEGYNRLDAIHELVLKIYPEPKGVDAVWNRSGGVSYFGSKRKYYRTSDDRLTFDYSNTPHFLKYGYSAGFFAYRCDAYEKNVLRPGYPGETGTWVGITANGNLGENNVDDTWTINGLPVMTMKPAQYKEDGYELRYPEPDRNVRSILVYRKGGTLPYVTVTRKQYLDQCISYHTKMFDEMIRNFEQMPVRSLQEQENEKNTKIARLQKQFANDPQKLKANVDYYLAGYKTDQQLRDEKIAGAKKSKDDEIKKFTDEMDRSKNEGLLNSPAMVRVMYYSTPALFETDPALGLMLVTENPDYIRKDLPKHVPQLFEISLSWNPSAAQENFAKTFQEKFPTDKLQAMIDK
jgi:hypothetical protein